MRTTAARSCSSSTRRRSAASHRSSTASRSSTGSCAGAGSCCSANDFAGQESRSNKDIATFCRDSYGVTFPMFAKTHVVGSHASGLFRDLSAATGAPVWNFNKYLLDRRGRVVAHWTQNTEPLAGELVGRIKQLL